MSSGKNHSGLCTNQEHYEQIEKVYAFRQGE